LTRTNRTSTFCDEAGEALALAHRRQVHPRAQAAVQSGVGRALEGVGQAGVAGEPDGDQVARVEGEQVLGLVDDPCRELALGLGQLLDARLDVAPQSGLAVGGLQPQGQGEAAVRWGLRPWARRRRAAVLPTPASPVSRPTPSRRLAGEGPSAGRAASAPVGGFFRADSLTPP